jgi:predicted AlkP superfamily pyrophosphatase or phosphodiesterase
MSDKPHVLNASLSEAITDLKEGFDVAFVYYTGMDVKGHQHGPDSDDIIQEVKDIDAVILQFLEDLKAEEMAIMTNFIIVADHGMTYNDDKVIN